MVHRQHLRECGSTRQQRIGTGSSKEFRLTVIVPRLVDPVVESGVLSRMEQPELLAGDHLVLRPWQDADVPSVVEAYSEPDIQKWNLRAVDTIEAVVWIDLGLNLEHRDRRMLGDRPPVGWIDHGANDEKLLGTRLGW